MRAGDLNDLVLPLISVDEYESKVDKKAVAFGFYVHDKDATGDLNRFVQKSPVALLSSEVSPAPDQHGYFIIFIELMDDARIGRNLADLLGEIEPLCGIAKWKLRVRKIDALVSFSPDNLVAALASARRTDEARVLDFLVPSLLERATVAHGHLVMEGGSGRVPFRISGRIAGFAPYPSLMREQRLAERPVGTTLRQIVRCNRVAQLLGDGWSALEVDRNLLIRRVDSDFCLLLRPDC